MKENVLKWWALVCSLIQEIEKDEEGLALLLRATYLLIIIISTEATIFNRKQN